jgi:uncharacterized protein YgiM (DUF1202 family)
MLGDFVKEDAVAHADLRKKTHGYRAFLFVLIAGALILAAVPPASGQSPAVVKVRASAANVRAEASLTGAVIATVKMGTLLEVVRKTGDWYVIKIPGGTATGFINASVVDEVKQGPGAAAAQPAQAQAPRTQALAPPAPAAVIPAPSTAQTGPALGKEQAQMAGIEEKIKAASGALLTLVQTMKPKVTEVQGTRQVKMAKVITARCQVLETNLQGARILYAPKIGEEFAVLGQSDSFFKVRLRDGREGWIVESCIQAYSKSETVKKVAYSGISGADQGNFLKVADGIFARLVQNKLFADEIASSFAAREDLPPQDKIQMVARAERIRGYFTPAADAYNLYIAGQSATVMEGRKFSEALSGWANLLLGTANYGANLLSGSSPSESGMTVDLSAGGSLELNPASKIELNVAQLSDVIDTPYSSTTVGAGYEFRGPGGLNAGAAASYNAYSDSADAGNSYGRFTLSGSGDYRLSEKTDLNLDYAFTNHAYNEAGNDGYSSHQIRFGGLFRPTASSRIVFHLRANLESSESEFHQFTNLEPAVSYEKTKENGRFAVSGRMEMFTFGDAEENNFSRTQLEVTSERSNRDILTSLDGGLAFKSFPNSTAGSYTQIRLRYARSRSDRGDRRFTATVTTDLYGSSPENSLTDIRLDHSASSAALFYDVGLYSRIWHKPAWGTYSSRPFVFDFLGRLGIRTKYFRIGPTVAVHALLSSEEGVELIARKGNVFRLGGAADAEIPLPKGGRLNLSAMYEYGFAYENTLFSYGGDLLARHPTDLQLRGDFSLPLFANLELVGQVDYFRIATDMDKQFATNPVTSNTKLKLLAGIRFRYN